jgi:hypothetical protein
MRYVCLEDWEQLDEKVVGRQNDDGEIVIGAAEDKPVFVLTD